MAYPVLDTWPGKKVLLKSHFGDIKGFEFKVHKKTFIMNMNDLSSNFQQVVLCKLHKEYTYSVCLQQSSKGAKGFTQGEAINYVAMKVDKLTHAYISVKQQDTRHSANIHKYVYGKL